MSAEIASCVLHATHHYPPAQPAKVTPFAGGNPSDVRRNRPPAQPAKATSFAGGNPGDVRRNRFLRFRPID
jgi:hypothetical protein